MPIQQAAIKPQPRWRSFSYAQLKSQYNMYAYYFKYSRDAIKECVNQCWIGPIYSNNPVTMTDESGETTTFKNEAEYYKSQGLMMCREWDHNYNYYLSQGYQMCIALRELPHGFILEMTRAPSKDPKKKGQIVPYFRIV